MQTNIDQSCAEHSFHFYLFCFLLCSALLCSDQRSVNTKAHTNDNNRAEQNNILIRQQQSRPEQSRATTLMVNRCKADVLNHDDGRVERHRLPNLVRLSQTFMQSQKPGIEIFSLLGSAVPSCALHCPALTCPTLPCPT
jgi:hypothetical protein